ncbi:Imm7 family immunity protein [Gorillibacterium massiliense]|uniref:Imm7 family immunity protein n=1 Tax=Gorillibacterium massiliense TaxID=1280390 RepID=UPI0009DDAD41|nr:Imm7 family immunity protein [Gorillibacterium massiliense]
MFQFNGWVVLRYHTHDNDQVKQENSIKMLTNYISKVDTEKLVFLRQRNGLDSLCISGIHNHRSEYVIELFQKIGEIMPGSYGLLYIQDDEDISKLHDNSNCFVVWKLVRGNLSREQDVYLSPVMPNVEDPFDENRND